MYVRLAFSVAAHLESEILIIDEVLAVGDAAFQKKCLNKVSEVSVRESRTVLVVSHSMPSVLNLCTKAIFLRSGEIYALGNAPIIVQQYINDVIETSKIDLAARDDRQGNGAVRFVRVFFESNQGVEVNNIRTGDEIVIVMEYENNTSKDLNNFHVAAGIRDLSDNVVCLF